MDTPHYRSLKTLGTLTTLLLAGNAGLAALLLAMNFWLDGPGADAAFADDEGSGLIAAAALIGILAIGIFIGTIVSFCMFVHRAASNLRAFGRTGLQYTPGWAVGWFFVPFANLVKPFHAMKEIVQASDPDAERSEYGSSWMSNPLPAIVNLWWGFWIIRMIVDRVSSRVQENVTVDVMAVVVEFAAVASAILLVQLVMRRQEALGGADRPQVRIAREVGHVADAGR